MDGSYIVSLDLASHSLRALHDVLCVSSNKFSELGIEGPWSLTQCQPIDNVISAKQTKLLLQVKLQQKDSVRHNRKSQKLYHTSGSVRERPMAIMPDVRTPSMKTGPMKVCMFGVRRNGTMSGVAYMGTCPETPIGNALNQREPLSVEWTNPV